MYFYEEGECITNTESALSRPSSFAREESDKVIYIQNGCTVVLEKQKLLDKAQQIGKHLTRILHTIDFAPCIQ